MSHYSIHGKYLLDDTISCPFGLLLGEIAQYIALGFLQYLEGHGTMMVLQRGNVVVAEGEVGLSIYLKTGMGE